MPRPRPRLERAATDLSPSELLRSLQSSPATPRYRPADSGWTTSASGTNRIEISRGDPHPWRPASRISPRCVRRIRGVANRTSPIAASNTPTSDRAPRSSTGRSSAHTEPTSRNSISCSRTRTTSISRPNSRSGRTSTTTTGRTAHSAAGHRTKRFETSYAATHRRCLTLLDTSQ